MCAAVGVKTEYFFVGNGITMHVKVFVTSEGIINVMTWIFSLIFRPRNVGMVKDRCRYSKKEDPRGTQSTKP